MPNSPTKPVAEVTPLRYATAQRLLGVTGVVTARDSEGRTTPAKVYPASEDAEAWVVESPADAASAVVEPKTFTGPAALLQAMQYAHDTYGSARFLSR